jgi:ribonuclease P protein component
LYKEGKHIDNKYFKLIVSVKDKFGDDTRLGYNISKKIGKAVVRNTIKRRVNEIFKKLRKKNMMSLDVLFIAKKPLCNLGFIEINDQINRELNEYLN